MRRRDFLAKAGMGFGSIPLAAMLAAENKFTDPMAAKKTHYPVRAKNVIFLFMEGGPSHLDTFDPKPLINKMAGKSIPNSVRKNLVTAMGEAKSPILGSKRKWKKCGKSGTWMSDWIPHMHQHADDICVLRGLWTNGINHSTGVCQMNTGIPIAGRPSLGSWVTYGLGTENKNLPAYVVMKDKPRQVINGPRNWSAGFMPAAYQGVLMKNGHSPIANLKPQGDVSNEEQLAKLKYLKEINEAYSSEYAHNSELDARIRNYELAYQMQSAAPDAINIDKEPACIKEMYGLNDWKTKNFGAMCLRARRMVEHGVRFIQLYSGAGSRWDAHTGIERNHTIMFNETDRPVSALLCDLKQRGMLEETLVIWGGEFGRTPMSEKGDGRDHNPTGFTMWMAGGGVNGGRVIGETDEFGLYAIKDKMHVHDLHATIMALLGIDHTDLIFKYKGRPERIDLNEGHVMDKVFT